MNLWAKRVALGLSVALALFLFACLDEENILGFPNKNQRFKISFVEIPLQTSVVLFDSLRTSNYTNDITRRLLVGRHNDPVFGQVETEAYTQLRPSSFPAKPTGADFDSVILYLDFDRYHYGAPAATQETYRVYELNTRLTNRNKTDYYSFSNVEHSTFLLGEESLQVSKERLDTLLGRSDTTVHLAIKIQNIFGQRLFNLWDHEDSDFTDFQKFSNEIRGLAIVGGESNQKVVGLSVTGSSRLAVYYHTDTTALSFNFLLSEIVSASKITVDRSGTALDGITPHQEFVPTDPNKLYIQSGAPVVTKVNVAAIAEVFADIPDATIVSAELSISDVDAPGDYAPPNSLYLQMMKGNRLRRFRQTPQDTADLRFYTDEVFSITNGLQSSALRSSLVSRDSVFTVLADTQDAFAQLVYDDDDNSYKGFISLFAQELIEDEQNSDNLQKTKFYDLVLYPGNPYASKSFNRTSFNKNNLTLKVFYSTPIEE